MKADQVGAQQSIEQFALPGAYSERLRVWPWNMPKNRHAGVRTFLLNEAGQQCEVIVLCQDHGVFDPIYFLQHYFGELLIDFLVVAPIAGAEGRPGISNMAE